MNSEEYNDALIQPGTNIREQQVLTLRFNGSNPHGRTLHELWAEHVSDVLEGISELVQDFDKAGAFHNAGPNNRDLFVRPAKEGSFIIELIQVIIDSPLAEAAAEDPTGVATALGAPTIGQIVWTAIRIFKDQVKDFDKLDDGNVKINWTDGTASEVSADVWAELNKRERRRKKQLRKIMRPLEDGRVTSLEARDSSNFNDEPLASFTKEDYQAVEPSEDEQEDFDIFETTGQLSAIDFDDPDRWKIKTAFETRVATVEDEDFLTEVSKGLNLNGTDSYDLKIREDKVTKNGRTNKKWTILKIQKEGRTRDAQEPDSGE